MLQSYLLPTLCRSCELPSGERNSNRMS
jgi:hypothetical protein